MANTIITIGREFGSGGRELGRRLAEELCFDYYDKEIVSEIAKKTAFSEQYIQQIVENNPHALYPITIGHSFSYLDSYTLKQRQAVFNEQENVIAHKFVRYFIYRSFLRPSAGTAEGIFKACTNSQRFAQAKIHTAFGLLAAGDDKHLHIHPFQHLNKVIKLCFIVHFHRISTHQCSFRGIAHSF